MYICNFLKNKLLLCLMMLAVMTPWYSYSETKNKHCLPVYEVQIAVSCDSEQAAEKAKLNFLPLPPGKNVAFSCRWDDNNPSDIRMKKLMQKYGYKGTFYLLIPKGKFKKNVMPELHKDGFTIGNHTLHHYNLSLLTPNGIFYEMLQARILLETLSGQTLTAFIFPGGSFRNVFYPEIPDIVGSCLRRTGMLGGPDNATTWLNKQPGNEFFTPEGGIIYPGDRNTSAAKFDAHVKRSMPSVGKTAHMTLGIHVWHSDKDFAELEKAMKKHSARQDWWYCNENEFLAYSYMFRYAKVTGKKVQGKTAVFTLQLPCPEYLGSETPLWAECCGKNIEIKHTRKSPEKIVAAAADGSNKLLPQLNTKISFTAPNRIRFEAVNNGKELEDVRLLLRLPPEFAEETLFVYVGKLSGKYQKDWQLTPATAWKSSGTQLTALQMDLVCNGKKYRIWVTDTREIKNKVDSSTKIFCAAGNFTGAEQEKLSLSDTPLPPERFFAAEHQLNYRETVFKVPAKAVNKKSLTVIVEFSGGKKMLLRGNLPKEVYCNGKKLKTVRNTLKFDAPAGKCRILMQYLEQRRALKHIQLILTPVDDRVK